MTCQRIPTRQRQSPHHHGWAALAVLLASLTFACSPAPEPADLVLLGGKIVTLDSDRPQAAALAARDGRIVAIGDDREIRRFQGPRTRTIDLDGHLAVPGFIEGHAHFAGLGASLLNVDLRGAGSWPEVVERVAAAAADAPPGEWILGRGWHQEKWELPLENDVEGYPLHDLLSRAVPDHPVVLSHASGHASMVNVRAMELSGIDASTPDPPGGEILRDARGRPTGVLRETAEELVLAARELTGSYGGAEGRLARTRRELELADAECLSKGITSFQDAGVSFATVDVMKEMAEAGELGVRLWVMLGEDNDALEARAAEYRIRRRGGGAPHHPRDQAPDRRSAGLPRRLAARTLRRPPRQHRPQHDPAGRTGTDRADRPRQRSATLRSRHRRPRQPRDPRPLRAPVCRGARARGPALAHRARPAPAPRRRPSFRRTGRDRVDAGHPLHLGRALGAGAHRRDASRRGRLRLARPDRLRRDGEQRHRRAGGGGRSDPELPRAGDPGEVPTASVSTRRR